MRTLISLGHRCDVAFQLRMHSGDNTAHLFDWLVTPVPGLIEILKNDFNVFRPEHLVLSSVANSHKFVRCAQTDIRFQHQFPFFNGNMTEDFLLFYAPFIKKMRYLADRFRTFVTSRPVTLVRRNINKALAEQLEEAFFQRFPATDVKFIYVIHAGDAFHTKHGYSVHMAPPSKGLGDPGDWAAMLQTEGLISSPYRLSTEEILGKETDSHSLDTANRFNDTQLLAAIRHNPNNPHFICELAKYYEIKGEFLKAMDLIEGALNLDKENLEFKILDIILRWKAGKLETTRAATEIIPLEGAVIDLDLQASCGRLLLQAGNYERLIAFCDAWLEKMPLNHALYALKSEALLALRRLPEAKLSIEVATRTFSKRSEYHFLLARILAAGNQLDNALVALEQAITLGAGPRCLEFYKQLQNRKQETSRSAFA